MANMELGIAAVRVVADLDELVVGLEKAKKTTDKAIDPMLLKAKAFKDEIENVNEKIRQMNSTGTVSAGSLMKMRSRLTELEQAASNAGISLGKMGHQAREGLDSALDRLKNVRVAQVEMANELRDSVSVQRGWKAELFDGATKLEGFRNAALAVGGALTTGFATGLKIASAAGVDTKQTMSILGDAFRDYLAKPINALVGGGLAELGEKIGTAGREIDLAGAKFAKAGEHIISFNAARRHLVETGSISESLKPDLKALEQYAHWLGKVRGEIDGLSKVSGFQVKGTADLQAQSAAFDQLIQKMVETRDIQKQLPSTVDQWRTELRKLIDEGMRLESLSPVTQHAIQQYELLGLTRSEANEKFTKQLAENAAAQKKHNDEVARAAEKMRQWQSVGEQALASALRYGRTFADMMVVRTERIAALSADAWDAFVERTRISLDTQLSEQSSLLEAFHDFVGETSNSSFERMVTAENARYASSVRAARGNHAMLEAAQRQHEANVTSIHTAAWSARMSMHNAYVSMAASGAQLIASSVASGSKKMFWFAKALAVAQVSMQTAQNAVTAWGQGMKENIYLAIAYAAAAVLQGVGQLAVIHKQQFQPVGQAHAGMDRTRSGSWMLSGNEMVLPPNPAERGRKLVDLAERGVRREYERSEQAPIQVNIMQQPGEVTGTMKWDGGAEKSALRGLIAAISNEIRFGGANLIATATRGTARAY